MNPGAVAGTTAATAAAAAAARRRRQEEEEMTPYKSEELAEGWEFKILRSSIGAFGKPQRLQEILDLEARAGWVLVEKFDDGRVRLKRPDNAKERDGALDFDPYCTNVPGETKRQLRMLGLLLVASAITIALVWYVVKWVN